MKALSPVRLLALNAYWFGLALMWNSLHPIVLPAVLLNFVPGDQKNTYLGVLTFAGLFIAMLLQPVAGAISDGWASRWGRRRPFILAGTLLDMAFLALLGWAGGLAWIVVGYLGLQVTSNVAHGAMQGLLPDRVPVGQLGIASAVKNLLDMSGLVIATLLAGQLLDAQGRYPGLVMGIVASVLAISCAITLAGTPEEPGPRTGRVSARASLRAMFAIEFRAHADYWWLIAGRFAFLLGVWGIQGFAQYYLRDVLVLADPVKETGNLLAAIAVSLIPFALIGGWVSDRLGARPVLVAAAALTAVGSLLLLFARTPVTLIAYGSVFGAGIGLFLTANWALANRLAPAAEAGKYLGLTNIATAGAGALSRLEGPAIDALNQAYPGTFAGYTALFLCGAAGAIISVLLLARVRAAGPAPSGLVHGQGE